MTLHPPLPTVPRREPRKVHTPGAPFTVTDPDTGESVSYTTCIVCGYAQQVA